jgi:ParB family chromosome partitioning protein
MLAKSEKRSREKPDGASARVRHDTASDSRPNAAKRKSRTAVRTAAPSSAGAFPQTLRATPIQDVPLSEIQQADLTFQYRLEPGHQDLIPSLRIHGQREPVDLKGGPAPYRIIDGFRRIGALRELGQLTIKAIVHEIDEERAHEVAFTKNVARRNLSPLEKAHAVVKALERGKNLDEIASDLNLSTKQVRRYADLGKLPQDISDAVAKSGVAMVHAFTLRDLRPSNPVEWAERCVRQEWSAKQLRREIRKAAGTRTVMRERKFIHEEKDCMRLYAARLSRKMPQEERKRAIEALKKAVQYLEEE